MAFRFLRNGIDIVIDGVAAEVEELAIESMAISKAINMYANVISKCEFRYYEKGKEKKNDLYYLLNVRPNLNQSATVFWHEVITRLFNDGEALVFQNSLDGMLYLADSFTRKKNLYFDDYFTDIESRGVKVSSNYSMKDVILLELNGEYSDLINSHYEKLAKIVDYCVDDYKHSNGRKFGFWLPSNFGRKGIGNTTSDDELKNKAQDYVDKIFKKMFSSFNAVIPFQSDEKLEEIAKATGKSVKEVTESINAVYEKVAIGMHIPVDIFFGKTTEKSNAMNDWITTGIGSIIEQIQDELSAKVIKKQAFLSGSHIDIDATRIKHRDLLDSANDIDKLHANGFTLNEIFRLFGVPEDTDNPDADKRFFTKNQDTTAPSGAQGGGE